MFSNEYPETGTQHYATTPGVLCSVSFTVMLFFSFLGTLTPSHTAHLPVDTA